MSVQEFLNSISNPRTRKGYRFGLNKFMEWCNKPTGESLAMRQEDLTQKPGENLVEYKNRAVRFKKEIEKFHSARFLNSLKMLGVNLESKVDE